MKSLVIKIDRSINKVNWYDILGVKYREYELKVNGVFVNYPDFILFDKSKTNNMFWGPISNVPEYYDYSKYSGYSFDGKLMEIESEVDFKFAKENNFFISKLEPQRMKILSCGQNIISSDYVKCDDFDFIKCSNTDFSAIILVTLKVLDVFKEI